MNPAPGNDTARPAAGRRRAARRAALQALYQWLITETAAADLAVQFERAGWLTDCDSDYFRALVDGVTADPGGVDSLFAAYLDRPAAQLDPVERAILMLGAFELRDRVEVPYRVVLNEALELAKRFGAQDGHRYVNGVLDRVARALRPAEAGQRA